MRLICHPQLSGIPLNEDIKTLRVIVEHFVGNQ
mgnify:CR=1 FL=1